MAINTIEYMVDIAGVTPAAEQFVGTQGDHRVAEIAFTISDTLYSAITAAAESGKVLYRFDLYDGQGGIWSSDATELSAETVSIELEERHTHYGGKITVYLVITALSEDNETEIELYSFPARLRLNNRPDGISQDGENYESITSLAEIAKNNAQAAENSNQELQEFAAEIEEKLKNGDFDGVGVQSAEIVNDELVITYTDNTLQNLGNVKGDKGDKGDMGATGATGKDGSDGVGIASVYIENGNLYVRKTNETSAQNLGRVKGDKGDTGNAVADGVVEAVADTIPLRDGNASINVNLGFMDVCDGLPVPMKKLDNGTDRNVIYWNGKKAAQFYKDTDGASADNPIVINTAEELAYVASAKYEDTYGKYFKIADGIDKIVLQSETYYKDIIALDSAEAVRDYFKEIIDTKKAASTLFTWVSNTWNEANMCFAGHFDGNGVEIYGMYTSDYTVANSGLSTNYAGGLFGLIDSAVITNVAVKNSYVNLGKGTENFQFGLIASYGKDYDTDKGDNVSYINNCIVANNYVYKQVNKTGFAYSGVLLGGNIVGNYIIQNCLVYGNSATGYYSSEYELPIIGKTINGLKATDKFIAAHPDWVFNDGINDLVETVLENSIVLGTPLHSPNIFTDVYAFNRVLSCNSISNCLKNVYVDWDLDKMENYSRDNYYNHWFNKDYFLANSGATITESDIIGDKAVTNAPMLVWGVDWFVPTTYSGKATPFEFTQFNQIALLNLINNNEDLLNKFIDKTDSKCITSKRVNPNNTEYLEFNSLYFLVSNSGKADIKLYYSNGAAVTDGDGNSLPDVTTCILIMPKNTIEYPYNRMCYFIGFTGSFSFTNMDVLKSRHFYLAPSEKIYCKPPTNALSVFKIGF